MEIASLIEFYDFESRAEVDRAFQSVDSDGSGKVDRVEFKNAIKDSRVEELGMSVILSQMDGHLSNMEDIFADYKKKLESGASDSAAAEKRQQEAIEALKNTARRRRLMKREMETKISELTRTLKKTLADVQGREIVSTKEEDLYYQLQDTFNAFDRDGSAELGFPEYKEAWK